MRTKRAEPETIEPAEKATEPETIEPATKAAGLESYNEKIAEIKRINEDLKTFAENRSNYKEKLKNELAFIEAEIEKNKTALDSSRTPEEYEAVNDTITSLTVKANYTRQQLQKSNYLKPADFHKYGDTITAAYNEMLEDFKKRSIEKCAELVTIVNEYGKFCDITNNAIHNLNNAAGIDPLTVNKDYSIFFKSDLYNSSEEYKYILIAIEKELGAAAYHELMCLARTPN